MVNRAKKLRQRHKEQSTGHHGLFSNLVHGAEHLIGEMSLWAGVLF